MEVSTIHTNQPATTEATQKQLTATQPRVVIIGSGFGGLQAAKSLTNAPVKVTIIDRNNHHLFQPMLYQVTTAGLTAHAEQNGKQLPGLAPVALQEAKYVASVITDTVAGKTQRRPFHYFNKGTLATVGRAFGVVDIGPIRFTGTLAWFTWLLVHIFFLMSVPNRIVVFIQYAWTYLTFQKGARIILPEGETYDHRN